MLTALHRPEFWGRPFLDMVTAVLRGPSFRTPGERECMAVAVSRLNECPFCVRVHTVTTRMEFRGEIDVHDPSVMRPELAAVLPLSEMVTTAPDMVTPDDVAPVRAAGVPDDAIVDALHVGSVFDTVKRMANAFDWEWESDEHVRVGAVAIHRLRYELPAVVTR